MRSTHCPLPRQTQRRRSPWTIVIILTAAAMMAHGATPATWAADVLPDNDVIMKACEEELARTMTLQLEDLAKPYFVQFTVGDTISYRVNAAFGAVTYSHRDRSRDFACIIRVGDYALDNTNFLGDAGGFRRGGRGAAVGGGRAVLPLDDDPIGIRQAIWAAADAEYKDAVETLTRKAAYMKDKNLTDRPPDFSKAPIVTVVEPSATLEFDRAAWESHAAQLSGRFKMYPKIQDSAVQVVAAMGNTYILNSEGTRLRRGDTGIVILINAEAQADDGMRFSNRLTYAGESAADLPPIDKIMADIDAMVGELIKAMEAPILENYAGPVLFDGRAAAQMFRQMLGGGVVGRIDPVGTQRRAMSGAEGLEKQLGLAVLPKSFQISDDPTQKRFGDELLFGWYTYDDEGAQAQKVDIVVNGVLKNMCMSRTPTKKLAGSNGHGRGTGGAVRASIGNLIIEDKEGIDEAQLKQRLIDAAKEAGLEYGIRVSAMRAAGAGGAADIMAMIARRGRRGGSDLGDPILVYKVFVNDGHEEPVRGCEFADVEPRELKKIVAAGNKPYVLNHFDVAGGGAAAGAIIAPPVLFEELELSAIEQEHDTLPILKAPRGRQSASAAP